MLEHSGAIIRTDNLKNSVRLATIDKYLSYEIQISFSFFS
jgi:hypothetical protein